MRAPGDGKTILLVDDDDAVLNLLRTVLQKDNYAVLLAKDGEEALDVAIQGSPHLVILDMLLPGLSGLDVCLQLRKWYRAPILILSGSTAEETIVEALDSGADDYLLKPVRPRELVARVRAILRRSREEPIHQAFLSAGDLKLDLAHRRVFAARKEIRFTRIEFDILACLVQNRDCVMTLNMLLDKIWGPTHGNYSQTLRVHIGHIRKKFAPIASLADAIQTEPGVGYRFSVPERKSGAAGGRRGPSSVRQSSIITSLGRAG